jgi:ribosomal 50S subunit-recycling heat shock protein
MGNDGKEAIRLDKWLWAARFFKTRSLAADAVGGARLKLTTTAQNRAALFASAIN